MYREMCNGDEQWRIQRWGGRGSSPPTTGNPMKPPLSLTYKFKEEVWEKERIEEEGEEKPLLQLFLDPSLVMNRNDKWNPTLSMDQHQWLRIK
jgi:hypothetical protein